MLTKAEQWKMFEAFHATPDKELDEKIERVEALQKRFDKESEAAMDAKFMLRHMRRIRAERLLSISKVVH